jgi:hypothetical protein
MAFISTLKFLAKFDQIPLIDEVSTRSLSVVGEGSVELVNESFGYQMQEQQYLRLLDTSLSLTNKATIGFWLNPVNPGVVRNPVSSNLEGLRMSVLDIRDLGGDLIVHVYERTNQGGLDNRLQVDLDGASATFVSSLYAVSQWHYFFIVYDGLSGSLRLFIDGKEDDNNVLGAVPATLGTSSGSVSVNRQAFGEGFDVADNTGGIDDVFIANDYITSMETLKKIINFSAEYAFDSSYTNNDEVDQCFVFNDPDAFRTTSLVDDGSSVLASRTDGTILEGLPFFWEVRRRFKEEGEIDGLDVSGDGFVFEDGNLVVNGKVIFKI